MRTTKLLPPVDFSFSILFFCTNINSIVPVTNAEENNKIPHFATRADLKPKRNAENRNSACEMLISFDEPFWEIKNKNMTELVQIANKHVRTLNDIFSHQIFIGDYSDMYFKLARVQVCITKLLGRISLGGGGLKFRLFARNRRISH